MRPEPPRPRTVPTPLLAALALAVGLAACETQAPEPGGEADAVRAPDARASAPSTADGEPRFMPYDVAPELENAGEVSSRLQELYPDSLENAGVGGSVVLWLRVDEQGRVKRSLLEQSSGHGALDRAASRIAGDMDFSPAMNRDERVGVWVQQRIRFEPDTAGG